jgi:hypothetical protein
MMHSFIHSFIHSFTDVLFVCRTSQGLAVGKSVVASSLIISQRDYKLKPLSHVSTGEHFASRKGKDTIYSHTCGRSSPFSHTQGRNSPDIHQAFISATIGPASEPGRGGLTTVIIARWSTMDPVLDDMTK